jgi:hypothetical protein
MPRPMAWRALPRALVDLPLPVPGIDFDPFNAFEMRLGLQGAGLHFRMQVGDVEQGLGRAAARGDNFEMVWLVA